MGLTVAAVVLTVGLAAARLIPPLASWVKSGGLRGRLWGWIPAIALTALLFWLFRGYVAVIRSAVFDSTLPYGDLRPLVPSFELAVMIINLILLSLALVVVGSGTALAVAGMLAGGRPDRAGLRGTVLLFLVAPFLAWALSHDPLVGWMARLLFAITAITGAVMLMRRAGPPPSWRLRGGLLVTFGLSAVVLLPVLSEMVDARERWRVETYAREVLRPIDTWLSYVVGETLLGFHTQEVREVLSGGGPDDLNQLAFTVWARSVACREGYPAVLAVTDTARMEVSRFTIGGESEAAASLDAELRLVDTTTQLVRLAGQGVNSIRLYGGVTPITDTSGAAFGFARLILTAGRRSLFRGGAPSILRATGQQGDDPFRDRIILSEFHEGVLLTSGSELFPVGYVLPVNVRRAFEDPSTGSFWSKHVVDERTYGSLFVRRDPESVVALSLLDLGPVRLLVGAEQMLGYYAVAMTLAGLLWLAYRAVRGQRLVFTFRDRLLAALLLTAIVPLVLISLYGRYDAGERLMQETARLLDDQTAAVSANLLSAPGGGVEALAAVTPPVVEAIASELGLDFNVYVDSLLVITSRPELYDLGILERRMPGSAYAATLLGGRRFHVEAEQIGAAQYAVGYRLMLDQEGLVAGTVSVPTAYRQEEIEEAVVRRNAFLLGVYVMVLVSLVVLAMLLANRIAAPIHRLTDATRLVARGDFDVSVRTSRTPAPAGGDEIDQLVASFEAMTRDLKKNREELIHYERELAWKEMAKQVAHEIKNPLTPMRLAVQHLRQTYRDRVEDFESVLDRVTGTVLEQIESLSRIASEFSHFARLPRRRIERCDLNAVVQESLGLCRQEGSTEFSLRLDPAEPAVEGDREELRRAFINVIKNGMQAMGGAGSMEIVTESGDDMATVLVHDTGPGIPEEVRVRLFEPNFSTKTEGMGLGLAIVKKTVDDMQGTITVESEPGQGTTVRITLPRAGDGK
jgi:signal transduction histidine kinase